jgi:membrane protein implicated in regulation of membrane protease activity
MPWWGWMIIGLFLLGSELLIVDVAFYLIFVGIAAIITGVIAAAGIVQEPWVQWLVFSVLALTSMVLFRKRIYQKLRGTSSEYQDGLTGETIRLEKPLDPGQTCRQSFRGTDWTVTNRGSNRIEAQSEVQIDSTEGLTIIVSGSNS